eukprot:CAMPEP_0206060660 /NCGR_PEP_ID=MMETSP1466-20131121/51853_1 /ASSEMBLY_ACC=CAM_ASM_001126 /TAXON_ID=44452 /ORGANISM="Pavlova gyrans, Strain CCMP608" /LENGTH=70 /DNA_ID=CAMNT_0053435999 /DNA_START=57 /DNA_END=267 /DNA_ORIENTATION=-
MATSALHDTSACLSALRMGNLALLGMEHDQLEKRPTIDSNRALKTELAHVRTAGTIPALPNVQRRLPAKK